jgi:hypothetical protein
MTAGGASLPLWYQGRGLRELPELQSHDRFRISWAKAAG